MTLLKNLVLLVWLFLRIEKWISKSDPDFIPYSVVSDLNTVRNLTLRENNFNFAVGLYDLKKFKWVKIKPEFGFLQLK